MDFESRMNDADALMWSIEKDPLLRSTITSLVVIDGEASEQELREGFERASRAVPRLRQRVRSNPLSLAPPRWEIDPNFDLHYHLRFMVAHGDSGVEEIVRLSETVAMGAFDRARPLWEASIIYFGEGQMALILKIHHAITDGVGAVKLMLEIFDLSPEPTEREMPEEPQVRVLNQFERFTDAWRHEADRQMEWAKENLETAGSAATAVVRDPVTSTRELGRLGGSVVRMLRPAGDPKSRLMRGRSLSVKLHLITQSLEEIKAAGHAAGGTINDAFVTGIILGIRKYHTAMGSTLTSLRMGMPINVRTEETQEISGNEFIPARFEIDASTDDPIVALERTRVRLAEIVDEPANSLVKPLSGVLNKLPSTFTTGMFGSMMKGLDFQASNVPGSPIPLYLDGKKVSATAAFGPLGGAAANTTLLSYLDTLYVGVNVDPRAVTEPELFTECLREGFADLIEATS